MPLKAVSLVISLLVPTFSAHAEEAEFVAGPTGGLLLPSFASLERTAFTLAAWSVGGFAHYGMSDNLSLGLSFDFVAFSGEARDRALPGTDGDLIGNMQFHGEFYHPQLFGLYKLYGGYHWAPYLRLGAGYLWSVYRTPSVVDDKGRGTGMTLADFGEGSASMSAALIVDYRFFNFLMAGVGISYTYVVDGVLEHFIQVPLTLACYW